MRLRHLQLLVLAAVAALVALWPLAAFAQDAAPAAVDPGVQMAQQLFDAIAKGDWWMVAGAGVALLVWALRKPLRPRMPVGLMAVLDKPIVAFLVPIVVALAGGLSAAAVAGPITGPVVVAVLLGTLKTSMAAAFSFLFGSNLKESVQAAGPSPVEAGAAAAAEVKTAGDAVEVFRKGPPAP